MASVNYFYLAKQVLAELVKRGDFDYRQEEEAHSRIEIYKDWLETYVVALTFEELDRLGRMSEFASLPDGDTTSQHNFLMRSMPNYDEFLKRAATEAGYALLGRSAARTTQRHTGPALGLGARTTIQ